VTVGRRVGVAPVPANLDAYLNDRQMAGLREAQTRGWSLKFVRRPVFQAPTVVLAYRNGRKLGLLQEDGNVNEHARIALRGDASISEAEPLAFQSKPYKHLV